MQFKKPTKNAKQRNQVLAAKCSKSMGRTVLATKNVCTTVGAQEALMNIITAVCNPGDEVVVLTPAYVRLPLSCVVRSGVHFVLRRPLLHSSFVHSGSYAAAYVRCDFFIFRPEW
jgi:aspartate/methionine/tyrosine aminotransferase